MLDMIELPDKAARLPSQLSNGQRQRVALARALVREPRILLLDEPMSALDAKLKETMQIELRHIHDRIGVTFIMVTHDQTEAMIMSDRIMVMRAGRIEQVGTPTELYDRSGSAYVADFLGTSNMIDRDRHARRRHRRRWSRAGDLRDRAAGVDGGMRRRRRRDGLHPAREDPPGRPAPRPTAPDLPGQGPEIFFSGNAVRIDLDIGAGRPFMVASPARHRPDRCRPPGDRRHRRPARSSRRSSSLFDSAEAAAVERRRGRGMNHRRDAASGFWALFSGPALWWGVVLLVPYVIMLAMQLLYAAVPVSCARLPVRQLPDTAAGFPVLRVLGRTCQGGAAGLAARPSAWPIRWPISWPSRCVRNGCACSSMSRPSCRCGCPTCCAPIPGRRSWAPRASSIRS